MIYRSLSVCENAILDARTNNISLINIIEEIQIMGFPTLLPHLSIVAQLQKEPIDNGDQFVFEIRIRINQRQLFAQPVTTNFMGRPKNRLILDMNGVPITESGSLIVELVRDGTVVLSSSIEMRLPERPQVTQAQ